MGKVTWSCKLEVTKRVKEQIESLSNLIVPDNAKDTHVMVANFFKSQGYNIQNEYPVKENNRKMKGYIDLYAYRDNLHLFIEIDSRSPRANSLFKLRNLENLNCYKFSILRRGEFSEVPEGLNGVVILEASAEEVAAREAKAIERLARRMMK